MWIRMIRHAFVDGPDIVRAGTELEVQSSVGRLLVATNKAQEIPAPAPEPVPAPAPKQPKAKPAPAPAPATISEEE